MRYNMRFNVEKLKVNISEMKQNSETQTVLKI